MSTLAIFGLEKTLETLQLTVPLPNIESAEVLTRPLDLCRIYLAELLSSLVGCDTDAAFKSIQWPNNIYSGDLAVILPKLSPGAKPSEVAVDLSGKFPHDHPLFPLPFLEGVHFRIFLEVQALAKILLPFILDRGRTYGNEENLGLRNRSSPEEGRKKLVVEFSSPNIASEFQGKHLRSTLIGAFVSRLHESTGWDITKINYLGDWGKPIALLKVGWDRFGNEETFLTDPVAHLLDVYHQIEGLFQPEIVASRQARDEAAKERQDEGEAQAGIEAQGIYAERNAAFKKLEEGDEDAMAFWERVRKTSIDNYNNFYLQLGVNFDEYSGESQVKPETMAEIEQLLEEKGITEESAGASVIHMQNYGLRAGTAIIRDRTGSSTYLLRELAAVLERSRQFDFDKMIIVAANDNSLHFTYLHHVLKALDLEELADKVNHLKFSEVSNMTDRLGKGYKPQAIIDHCEEVMVAALEVNEEKASLFNGPKEGAKVLGVSALLAHELSTRTASVHSFDTAAMTAFKAGTGPQLQYCYHKLSSLLKDCPVSTQLADEDFELFLEDEPANLLRILAQYPEVTHATYQSLEASAIITYLASVVEQVAECLEGDADEEEGVDADAGSGSTTVESKDEQKIDAEAALTPSQIALYEAARIVLENGMGLLGLRPYATLKRVDTPAAE